MGSPPVRMIIGLAKLAMFVRSFSHSSVESSPEYGPFSAAARQWRQLRLHERVTSHATRRNSFFLGIDG
jgi:hypothetical protein